MQFFIFIAGLGLAATAAAGVENVGTTSAAFLKLGSGSRPAALGDAYVAVADDASAMAYNPAGLSQMLAGDLQMTHTEWFQGLRYEDLDAVFSLGDGGMIGATFNFLSVPSITRTEQIADSSDPTQNFQDAGSFSPFDLQFALAYARPLLHGLLGGLNLKVLSQSIDDRSTMGLGVDVGALYLFDSVQGLSLGLAVQNLGTPIKLNREAFDLPLLGRAGLAYRAMDDKLLMMLEGDVPSDESPVLALGLEYDFSDRFYPRVGYRLDNIFNPWSVGLGAKFSPIGLDLSIVPYGELGLTYRATLSYSFGNPSAELVTKLGYLSSQGIGKGAVIEPQISAPDKVAAWGIFIYDSSKPSKIVRQLQGHGPVQNQVIWDGKLNDGSPAPEGVYWAVMSARYKTGKTVNTKYLRLEVNNTPPQVDLSLDPASVNSQASGEGFVPTLFKGSLKGRAATHWRLDILDSQGKVFRSIRGDGNPPESGLLWDGKGDQGDDLVSGQVYQARLSVTDPLGNEASNPTPVSFRAVFR